MIRAYMPGLFSVCPLWEQFTQKLGLIINIHSRPAKIIKAVLADEANIKGIYFALHFRTSFRTTFFSCFCIKSFHDFAHDLLPLLCLLVPALSVNRNAHAPAMGSG